MNTPTEQIPTPRMDKAGSIEHWQEGSVFKEGQAIERELAQAIKEGDKFAQYEAKALAEAQADKERLKLAIDFAEWGWTIIASAGGGDWTKETPDWVIAAEKYRDDLHSRIRHLIEEK